MTTETPQAPSLMEELKILQNFFVAARDRLKHGSVVNMVGIEKRIAQICDKAQKASTTEQRAYLPELSRLIELLNGYEQDLRLYQAKITGKPSNENDKPAD